jgi:large subunit ribosomal protein L25
MSNVQDVILKAQDRADFGKGAARALRRNGLVPAVMYGSGSTARHIVLPAHETGLALRIAQVVLKVEIDGQTFSVAPRDVQRDPVRTDLLHLDLVLLSRADVAERHAFSDALELAKANAEEAGLDAMQAAHVIEEAQAAGEDLQAAAEGVVETLKEQAKAYEASAVAAETAEGEAALGESEAEAETAE